MDEGASEGEGGCVTHEGTSKEFAARLEASLADALMGGPHPKRRQTALRLNGRSFEAVELDDAGNAIEPLRCTCGNRAVFHRSGCPVAYVCS